MSDKRHERVGAYAYHCGFIFWELGRDLGIQSSSEGAISSSRIHVLDRS